MPFGFGNGVRGTVPQSSKSAASLPAAPRAISVANDFRSALNSLLIVKPESRARRALFQLVLQTESASTGPGGVPASTAPAATDLGGDPTATAPATATATADKSHHRVPSSA